MFRFKKSIPVSYDDQGYIYFTSRRYKSLPAFSKRKVESICRSAGGAYCQALFEFVTTDAGATEICAKHYLSASTLERIVRRYYIAFADTL